MSCDSFGKAARSRLSYDGSSIASSIFLVAVASALACGTSAPDGGGNGDPTGGGGATGGNASGESGGGSSDGGRPDTGSSSGGSTATDSGAPDSGRAAIDSGGGGDKCVKGETKGKDVAIIGESFLALTHGITQEIEKQARAAGALGANDHYVDNSVSGTTLANNQIPSQYTKAVQGSGTTKYVLMDGGGNDCLLNNNGDAAYTAAVSLFQTMQQNKTEKVLYFFYPDPIGSQYASLKTCLDALRPKMKSLCDGLTSPKCYWLDLRPTWNGHPEYTSDGIHPTTAGSVATGDVIWSAMQTSCVAQ
jgi:hypothetical protein